MFTEGLGIFHQLDFFVRPVLAQQKVLQRYTLTKLLEKTCIIESIVSQIFSIFDFSRR